VYVRLAGRYIARFLAAIESESSSKISLSFCQTVYRSIDAEAEIIVGRESRRVACPQSRRRG